MNRIHVVGGKNHGKTTLVVDLVEAFLAQGLRVGTIKHTHHDHELDTPGKDSHRHRVAGSHVVGICSPALNAVFWPPPSEPEREQKYAKFAPLYAECDIVLVEGDSKTTSTKIEVWRSEVGTRPLAEADTSIAAVISDSEPILSIPWWPRSDVEALTRHIQALAPPSAQKRSGR